MNRPKLRKESVQGRDAQWEFFSYDSGWLETKNSGWRSQTPIVDSEKCVGCGLCYKYCPDGVISIREKKALVDYDFCKGCGICETICKCQAIRMERG